MCETFQRARARERVERSLGALEMRELSITVNIIILTIIEVNIIILTLIGPGSSGVLEMRASGALSAPSRRR